MREWTSKLTIEEYNMDTKDLASCGFILTMGKDINNPLLLEALSDKIEKESDIDKLDHLIDVKVEYQHLLDRWKKVLEESNE